MSDKNSSSEPSMEQILESIAEIIADDQGSLAPDTAPRYEAVPVMHTPTPVNSDVGYAAPAPAFLQASSDPIAPVAEPVSTGSLTDRLANMTPSTPEQATESLPVRPVPEDVALTPPGFMGQEVSSYEPIPVNAPIPQMMGQQPTMSAQGFPVESAEDFLANNAKRVEADAFAPQQMAETVTPQIPVQQAPEFALNPALVPTVTPPEPVVQTAPIAPTPIEPQVVEAVSQPTIIEQPVPQEQEVALSGFAQSPVVEQPAPEQTVAPVEVAPIVSSPADDVFNSFHQVEKEQVSDVPVDHSDVSLLDASYMSTAAQTPLVAEPVMDQVETVTATTMTASMQNPVLATEEVNVETVSDVGGVDLNSAIHAMVQPMVKKWLDENLSKVVEDVVRNELASALTKK